MKTPPVSDDGQSKSTKETEQNDWGMASVMKYVSRNFPGADGPSLSIPLWPLLGAVVLVASGVAAKKATTRYLTAEHIPPKRIEQQIKIRGVVTSVGDSDNFRLWHTPFGTGWWWRSNIHSAGRKSKSAVMNHTPRRFYVMGF
jgi:hypothetical protein